MNVKCPGCKKILSVPDEYGGKHIKCKYCQKILKAIPLNVTIVVPTNIIQNFAEQKKAEIKKLPEYTLSLSQNNFLTKIWTKSPVPFRTAFLATLGVVSALLAVYYVYGFDKWLKQPTNNYNTYMSTESAKSIPIIDTNAYHLAVLIRLSEYQNSLETLQQIREEAANKISNSSTETFQFRTVSFFGLLFCLQNQLEKLYVNTKELKVPENQYFITAHQNLLAAIDAEYSFEKSLLDYPQNSDNLYILSQIKDKGNQLVELSERSSKSLLRLYSAIDPKLFDAFIQTYKDNN